MEKRISYSQFQSVKCVAKACDPLITKRAKLREKIEKIAAEYKDCDTQISSLEEGIVKVMGFHVDELVKKVVEPGVDVNGQPKKTTKYVPTSIVSYDEKHKQYVITIPDAETEVATDGAETTATTAVDEGNDPVNEPANDPVNTEEVVAETPAENTEAVPSGDEIFA